MNERFMADHKMATKLFNFDIDKKERTVTVSKLCKRIKKMSRERN